MTSPFDRAPDRARPMPATPAARLDAIQASLAALHRERRRFERLGFERPQARCHEALRFWTFLAALHALPAAGPDSPRDGSAWPAPPAR